MVMMSSRSHRGRNSFVVTTRGVAPRGMGFVVARKHNILYTPVARRHYTRLRLSVRIATGASVCRAPFAIAISLLPKYAAKMSVRSHTTAVHTLTSPGAGPASLNHPKRIGPLHTHSHNILHHTKRARTDISLTGLTKLCPTTTLVRVVGRSNAVTHLPRLVRITGQFKLGVVSVGSLVTCHIRVRSLIRGKMRIGVPARCKGFHLVPFQRGSGKVRRITVFGNA